MIKKIIKENDMREEYYIVVDKLNEIVDYLNEKLK